MSDFNYQPAFSPSVSHRPRALTNNMGDGYDQRTQDGINTDLRTWQLTFTRTLTDIDAIEAFLSEKAGAASFTWTYRGEEVRVVCSEWSATMLAPRVGSISCTFREVPV